MQTVMWFSRCGAGFGNKKSPHNNLNLTIPSGMALVRVCYVAIRKLKTCSGSFGSRAGTLSKYVILNCWDRLPQKSSRVNKKFWKYAAFGGLQENARETLSKRERAGWCQPSWQCFTACRIRYECRWRTINYERSVRGWKLLILSPMAFPTFFKELIAVFATDFATDATFFPAV